MDSIRKAKSEAGKKAMANRYNKDVTEPNSVISVLDSVTLFDVLSKLKVEYTSEKLLTTLTKAVRSGSPVPSSSTAPTLINFCDT